jgi:hypothetical protein
MASSGMLRLVAFVITDVSEELGASIIRVTRLGEIVTTSAVTSNRGTDSCHPDDGSAKFLRSVTSQKTPFQLTHSSSIVRILFVCSSDCMPSYCECIFLFSPVTPGDCWSGQLQPFRSFLIHQPTFHSMLYVSATDSCKLTHQMM